MNAEIENARDYLAECVAMESEALVAGDRLLHIQLGFIRLAAAERLRDLQGRAMRIELAKAAA